jgi:hypothetical protein
MKKSLLIFIIISTVSLTVTAQDTIKQPVPKAPVLNGHKFPSLAAFRSPFIVTSFEANIGIGQTSKLTIPGFDIGDYELFAFEGSLLFVGLNIQYQQRFNDWLALFFTAKLAARIGSNMSTILVDGVNTIAGGEIGWLIKIYQGRKISLSGSIGLKNITGSFINVKDYFEEIINNNPDPSITKVIPAMSLGAGLYFAYAISPTFGMQSSLGYAYGESFIRGEKTGYYHLGLAFDVDFNPAKRVPVGISLGYSLSSIPEIIFNYQPPTNILIAILSYTGSEDFELGLQYNVSEIKSANFASTGYLSLAQILFKYYF